MKPIKTIITLHNSPEDSPFLSRKFQRLKEEGYPFELVFLESKSVCRYLMEGVSCLLKNPSGSFRYFQKGSPFFKKGLIKKFLLDAALIKSRPKQIHFEFGTLAVGRMHLKELLGCKILVSFRGYDLNYAGLEDPHYYSEVWKEADVIHVLGHDLWKRALERGCPPDKPHVFIPPAIDTVFFQFSNRQYVEKIGTKEKPVKILSVGRLVWKKGCEYALQAVRLLRDQGIFVDYRIIGTGDYLEAIAFSRHQLKLDDCVKLLGTKTAKELKKELEEADIFLHAAVSEGFCNAVVEAQSMGLPVVTSDADGLGENIENGQTGFVVPRRDPKALAEKMILLIESAEVRRQMGQKGRERVLKYFKIEDQIEAFKNLYKKYSL